MTPTQPIFLRRCLAVSVLLLPIRIYAESPGVLTLEDFKNQVLHQNLGVRASFEASAAALQRMAEKSLVYSPNLFANAEVKSDATPPVVPIPDYSKINSNAYQLGVSQPTPFGLESKLYYDWRRTQYITPSFPPGLAFPPNYYQPRPTLELTQSLLQNGWGRRTKANRSLLEAQAFNASYTARHAGRTALVEAQAAYWRLLFARDTVAVQKEALLQAQKIFDYAKRRADLHLTDAADSLQARAAVQVRELELQSAQDEERAAERAFNTARHTDTEEVPETLARPDWDSLTFPDKGPIPTRDDVRAAEAQARIQENQALLSIEKNRPALDLYAAFSLNTLQQSAGDAWANSWDGDHPTKSVGLRLAMPLNLWALRESRRGYARERDAARVTYEHKQFEEERDWKDLLRKIGEARRRLELNRLIEKAQQTKLEEERKRLRRGRTTTYQVLLFEQDYSLSQIDRLRAESAVMTLLTQTSLYGDAL